MRHVLLVVVVILLANPASATLQRTFVSHKGLDTNPCSVDMPCRSFAVAIT